MIWWILGGILVVGGIIISVIFIAKSKKDKDNKDDNIAVKLEFETTILNK